MSPPLAVFTVVLCYCKLVFGTGDFLNTCPSEHPDFPNILGKRLQPNKCATVVANQLLETGSVREAELYCSRYFNSGDLELENVDIETNNSTVLLNHDNADESWDSFVCTHSAYLDCLEEMHTTCEYSSQFKSCIFKTFHVSKQVAQRPFGRNCKTEIESTGLPCSCSKCSNTEWTQWRSYFSRELIIQTRYRPYSEDRLHDCMQNSSRCCSDHILKSVGEKWANIKLICLNNGDIQRHPDGSSTCACKLPFHGVFCELGNFNYRLSALLGFQKRQAAITLIEFLMSLMFLFLVCLCLFLPVLMISKCLYYIKESRQRPRLVNDEHIPPQLFPSNKQNLNKKDDQRFPGFVSTNPWLYKSTVLRDVMEARKQAQKSGDVFGPN